MAEPEQTQDQEQRTEGDELPPMKPIPPEYYKRGGCGFTGCMYAAMIFAAIAMILMVIGLMTRIWTVPVIAPR